MSISRGIFGWVLAAGALSATIAGANILLTPPRIEGPVVPPIHVPPAPVKDPGVMGEKI